MNELNRKIAEWEEKLNWARRNLTYLQDERLRRQFLEHCRREDAPPSEARQVAGRAVRSLDAEIAKVLKGRTETDLLEAIAELLEDRAAKLRAAPRD